MDEFENSNIAKALEFTKIAIEKQTPKKVVHSHHCPSCDNALPRKDITDDYCSCCFNWKYCPICGQRLEW